MISIGAGFAFFPNVPNSHMHVVINDPRPPDDEVAFVNLTTRYPGSSLPVVLQRGDHPFIEHDTTLAFHKADVRPVAKLEAAVKAGLFKPHPQPLHTRHLQRIATKLIAKSETPQNVRNFLIDIFAP